MACDIFLNSSAVPTASGLVDSNGRKNAFVDGGVRRRARFVSLAVLFLGVVVARFSWVLFYQAKLRLYFFLAARNLGMKGARFVGFVFRFTTAVYSPFGPSFLGFAREKITSSQLLTRYQFTSQVHREVTADCVCSRVIG